MMVFNIDSINFKKNEIACDLIDIVEGDLTIKKDTISYIVNWIWTGPREKRNVFYDVWEIVLKNYLSKEDLLYLNIVVK